MSSSSEFERWFIAQHGPRKSSDIPDSDRELHATIMLGERAREELEQRKLWDARWQSALYAWQARGQ